MYTYGGLGPAAELQRGARGRERQRRGDAAGGRGAMIE